MRALTRACLPGLALLAALPARAVTIKFWAVTGDVADVTMYQRMAADFEQKTGIHVEITPLGWGSFETKYFAAMAAGIPPDIGVTNLGGPLEYGSVGGLVDLKSAFPKQVDELTSRFFPGMMPMFTFRGKLFAVPADVTTTIVYYRTDTFAKLGIQPPQTWSQLNSDIDVLAAHGYHYFYGFPSRAQWGIFLYSVPYGLWGISQRPNGQIELDWQNPLYQKGVFEALHLWYGADPPGPDVQNQIMGMFRSSDPKVEVPMMIDLPNAYTDLPIQAPEIDGKWSIVPWPRADDGTAFNIMGGTSYVIFSRSKHQKEAFQWLMYLTTVKVYDEIILDRLSRKLNSTFTMSPLVGVWGPGNDAFWNRPELASSLKLRDVLRQVMPTLGTVPGVHGTNVVAPLESNLLDRMGTFIEDRYSSLAQSHGLSRWQYVQALARGEFPGEKQQIQDQVRARLKSEYASIAPGALSTLQKETTFYEQRYGNIINELQSYQDRPDVLTWLERGALAFLLGLAGVAFGPRKLRRYAKSYLFIAPPIVLTVVFVVVPALTAFWLSFTQYHPVLPLSSARPVGLQNYRDVIHSGDLTNALWRTCEYVLFTLPVGIGLSLVLAALLNQKLVGLRAWRFIYLSPLVTSAVSVALVFTQLFLGAPQGWINAFLLKAGLVHDVVDFLHSERTFLMSVIIFAIWSGLAFSILIFLAGLQQIPAALYEAADLDGASPARKFWNVSIPGILPQIAFVSILGLIGAFQVFEPIYILGGGTGEAGTKFGPNDSGMTMVPLIYHTGFETFEMGKSAAIAYVLFAVILLFTVVQLWAFRRKGESA